jgi:hypothetical protein
LPDATEQGELSEAELRNKRAAYELRNMLGTGLIDISKVLRILQGDGQVTA